MKSMSILVLLVISLPALGAAHRNATTKEEMEAESQIQARKGDLGEQAMQKQEHIKVDTPEEERLDYDEEIFNDQDENLRLKK